LQRERRTLAGLIAREERKDVLALLRNAQRLLATVEVLNPFATALTFPSGRTRNRRDHEKYLTLIDAIALLHQHQRPRGQHVVGSRVIETIEVTFEDIALANELAPEVLGRSLDELPPQTRRLLNAIREVVKVKRAEGQMGQGSALFSRKEVRDATGWSLTQVSVHLHRLVELEYLVLRCGRMGGPFLYELLIDMDAPEAAAHIGLIDVAELRLRAGLAETCVYHAEVTGKTAPMTGGDRTTSATSKPLNGKAVSARYRPDANAHQEAAACAAPS
jgi:hypothetical protein